MIVSETAAYAIRAGRPRLVLEFQIWYSMGGGSGLEANRKGAHMLKDFKEFVMRGNVLDLAIAVIIGAAFGGIVTSMVNDIVMPPVGLLLGRVDFKDLFIALNGQSYPTLAAAKAAAAPVIAYGQFLNTVINFLIIAFVIFMIVRQASKLQRKPAAAAAPITKDCTYCCTAIPIAAKRCPNCTSDLRAEAASR
jgi:large conductance mechanosensitive channel